ncbi:protein AAR2 homolog [Sitodiplosis mosellana]|uniref:protein AAR2 homolog n=1 Tax=Sitodiplosis mosellana TaxID=263140 RepID=UPI002444F07A|nr:protein AAR2 homolog [Sitodiplosis mosellana]
MAESTSGDKFEIPQDMARILYEEGALLIIAGVPVGTEFGVDLSTNKVDEMFRGVKMIPPGTHFVYTAAEGIYGDTAARVGFVHYFKKQEIVIREWDQNTEELRHRSSANIERDKARIRENLADLDKFLAPYDFQQLKKWQQLSNEITEEVIARTEPECSGVIRSSAEFQSCSDADRPKGQSPLTRPAKIRPNQTEDELLPNLKVVQGTAPRFTKIPALYPNSASPAEISESHLDAIRAIETYFSAFLDPFEAIREIQMSFILFLCGCSVDALAHWRKILGLLAKSDSAVSKFNCFYRRYLEILKIQLPELPEELMMPTSNNTVYKDVRQLIINCSLGGLKDEADVFTAQLTSVMSWYFDDLFDENPEDLPVIVEI